MGSERYKTLHLLKFSPLVDVQDSLQVPRGHTHSQNKTLCRSVSEVWAQTPCPTVKNYNPSHLPAPPQVPGGCVSAEYLPTQLPQFCESTRPKKSISSCVWPRQTGFQNASNLWGPAQGTCCWRAGLGPWGSLDPSLLETPREPSHLQHPERPGSCWYIVPSSCQDAFQQHMSVPQRSQGDLLSPAHVCLCTALCTVLALEETKMNHSQTWRQKKVTTGNYYFFFFFRFCGGGGSSGVIFTKNP